MTLPFAIRSSRPTDMPFIENAWRGSMLSMCPAAADAEPKQFHAEMARVFERLMPAAVIRVACDPQDDDNLTGFVVVKGTQLLYVYVLGPFRRLGLVPAMLDGLTINSYLFSTTLGLRRLKPRVRGWSYTPRWTLY